MSLFTQPKNTRLKMKICIDARMIYASGIGRYIQNLIPYFLEQYDVTLLGNKKELNTFFPSKKIKIIEITTKIYSIQEQFRLAQKVPKCDLFWSPHYNIPLLPIKAKKKMVTIHDVYHLAFYNTLSTSQKMYAKLLINQAVKRSDIILTVSNFSKKEILKYTHTHKQMHVVYNAIDKSLVTNQSFTKENYILYVGNVKPHKNLVRALKAFEETRYKNFTFKIVGQKNNFITKDTEVEQLAKKLGNRVEFTGYVKDSELVELYKKAKLFLFPTLYEGFGIPPLEAQACGTPVICSNIASLPEVGADSVLYCDPYDIEDITRKINLLIGDPILQQELINKGYENLKRFSWENSAKQIINIIEDNR